MSFIAHARTVAVLTFASRITGLARDATLSRVFGAGALLDAFFFAFMIPNLFRRLFGEGALSAAFLPVYSRLLRDDPATSRRLASLVLALLVSVLGALVMVAEILLLRLAGADGERGLTVRLLLIMLPYMPMVCVVAVLGSMLQVHRRFGPTAAAPIVLNIAMIVAAIGGALMLQGDEAGRRTLIALVAASVLVAGVIQVAWSLHALRDQRWWTRDWSSAKPALREVLGQALPMILGLGVLQLNTFVDGLIASYPVTVGETIFGVPYPLEKGAMAFVSFAQRLYQFPLGVFGIALATAIFPALARVSDDDAAFAGTMRRGLRLVLFIGLPASAGLILVRQPLVAVILQGGAFGPADVERVSFVLLGYASAVWAYSAVHVMTRAFYARGDARTPVRVAAGMVVLNLVLNCTLIWTPLREAGLGWSTALCSVVQAALLGRALRARTGELVDREMIVSAARTLGLTIVMTIAVGAVVVPTAGAASWTGSLLVLAAAVALGATIMIAGAAALKMPELSWVLRAREEDVHAEEQSSRDEE